MPSRRPPPRVQDESDSEGDESDGGAPNHHHTYSGSEYDESEGDEDYYEDDREEDDRRSRTRPAERASTGGRSAPRRSKSFQDDDGRLNGQRGNGESGRRLPNRSTTFDGNASSRLRMPRREHNAPATKLDREAIASNRARRLRAMGGGDAGGGKDVKLLRRGSTSRNQHNGDGKAEGSDEAAAPEEKKDEGRRKPPNRSASNDLSSLAPEERQYARTAARGVTRSKSLKAERPNLDQASKNVAARLGKLSVATKDSPRAGLKF